ncbi:MAG TPA: NAD(P)-binding protein [Terriglobales bacterium]|nr:NAD(P)-binding protein [Terriglobales bacterium]
MSDLKNNTHKIGVYVCDCGSNIAGMVDVPEVVKFASTLPNVAIAREHKYMCSDPGQDTIKKDIKELGLTRVVVSSCSPLMHEPTFRNAVQDAGLNQYLFQMANIREQCSWVTEDRIKATEKAKKLVAAAVERVILHEPLKLKEVAVNPNVLVVGGGIAGIEAALQIANSGKKVYLVEKSPSIGGHMAQLDKTFPTLDCSACILTPKMVQVGRHPNIELMSYSEVTDVSGFVGNFKVKVKKKSKFVEQEKCKACGDCEKECPVERDDEYEMKMKKRKAIYRYFPQAVPNTFLIDKTERPPCKITCPIEQDASGYTALIAQKKYQQAIDLVRKKNPLPIVCSRVCYHPCETACRRGDLDEPISICHLKRFLVDWEMEKPEERYKKPEIKNEREEKVAIIGSGPAGLACAYDLRLLGYQPTIFEELDVVGGMLHTGIPEYRLPKKLLKKEIDRMKDLGIKIKTNTKIGKNFTLGNLKKQGFDAVFIATGAHKGLKMKIPGEELAGVFDGVEFLREVSLGKKMEVGKRVAVIGGGNTAVDVARTVWRLGADEVNIVYRRTIKEMPAAAHEIEETQKEGIKITYLTAPLEIIQKNGKVSGIKCIKMKLGEPDSSGRRRPVPVEGSEHEIKSDMVIAAVSQAPDLSFMDPSLQLKVSKWETLETDPLTMVTNQEGVFAGGDLVTGPATVVEALACGKRAAISIDRYLNNLPLDSKPIIEAGLGRKSKDDIPKIDVKEKYKDKPRKPRMQIPGLSIKERAGNFKEVELSIPEKLALEEASRCLQCGPCVECFECVRVCEAKAVNHSLADQTVELDVGAVVIATGFDTYDPVLAPQYGYKKYDNVLTSMEFERLSHAGGVTGGRILLKNGKEPESVAILHCIGSRDENANEYCSRVCCMYSLKFAHLVKEKTPAKVYELYIDMRSFGKGYEEFYKRLMHEGVLFVRGKGAEITDVVENEEEKGKLIVKCEDTLLGFVRRIPVDMVILSTGLQPQKDVAEVTRLFTIQRSRDGFFLEKHPKLAPVATATDGVFLAGACQGPKDIPDSVAQGAGAAANVIAMIDKGVVSIEPIVSYIDPEKCAGCKLCLTLCPYNAIEFNQEKKVSQVQEALCKGCGTCVASCPSGVPIQYGFRDEQILAEIEGALESETLAVNK